MAAAQITTSRGRRDPAAAPRRALLVGGGAAAVSAAAIATAITPDDRAFAALYQRLGVASREAAARSRALGAALDAEHAFGIRHPDRVRLFDAEAEANAHVADLLDAVAACPVTLPATAARKLALAHAELAGHDGDPALRLARAAMGDAAAVLVRLAAGGAA